MKMNVTKRLLSLLLVCSILAGFLLPVRAAEADDSITFTQVDNSSVTATPPDREPVTDLTEEPYDEAEVLRVSIVLETRSTLEAGFSTQGIAGNAAAQAYRADLRQQQDTMVTSIEKATGEALDVVWNLTLAANIISANVEYGQI